MGSAELSNEERQQVQSDLLAIQRDPCCGPCIPCWLTHPALQVQFFGAQCLLVRINRDWDNLEEEEQVRLQLLIGSLLTHSNLTVAARNKLEEALVKVMEKAFLSGWWKDPIGDLLNGGGTINFNLLALIPITSSTSVLSESTTKYTWHHEIKSHSSLIINTILALPLDNHPEQSKLLECIRNWTNFGAFSFGQVEKLLPTLVGRLRECGDETEIGEIVECLVEICELVSRDPVEEARKARHILPACLHLATINDLDRSVIVKLTASLAEESPAFLVESCHNSETQSFLKLLLELTNSPGIAGIDDTISDKTLNAWYLLTEEIECAASDSNNNKTILIGLFANSLVPILLAKSTFPVPQIWSEVPRDLQQQFIQIRREFLDTLLYIQRALTLLGSPDALLQIIYTDLQQLRGPGIANSKSHIEARLRALIVIAEESDKCTTWQNLTGLVFESQELTRDPINAKLAISLVGSLLPAMEMLAKDSAAKMLLDQLQSNPLVRDECLGALQQAADCEVPLLADPQIIAQLINLLAAWQDQDGGRSKLLRLLSRLVADLAEEAQRWEALNILIRACMSPPNYMELAVVLKTPFTFSTRFDDQSSYAACLEHLKQIISIPSGEALLAAWIALSGSEVDTTFSLFQGHVDPWQTVDPFLSILDKESSFLNLGAKLLSAWVHGMTRVDPECCLILLESATSLRILTIDPHEDALEAILDAWIHFIKHGRHLITGDSPHMFRLFNWILRRISIGQLSVPLLRSFSRFLSSLFENKLIVAPEHLFPVLKVIFSAGISGKIGRSGMEILARPVHDISLLHPDFFRSALNQILRLLETDKNSNDQRAFLRNLGAAHTIKKFKSVLVDFCLESRGIAQ